MNEWSRSDVLRREAGAVGIADLLLVVLVVDAAQNAMASEYKSITVVPCLSARSLDELIHDNAFLFLRIFHTRLAFFTTHFPKT